MPGQGIHRAARVGFQAAADAYERGRPDYPQAAVEALAQHLRIEPGCVALDLAAGTGKLTGQLVPFGARVIAVEPVEAMRATLARSLPTVEALGGRAEAIPLGDGVVDAAVVAQAFHWFDPTAALAELHRVLRPGGQLGVIYNVRDETVPLHAEFTRIFQPYRGDTPSHETRGWRHAFEHTTMFTPLEKMIVPHHHRLSRQGVVDRALSISFIAELPGERRRAVGDEVLAALDRDPETRGKEIVDLPYRTDVYWCGRR